MGNDELASSIDLISLLGVLGAALLALPGLLALMRWRDQRGKRLWVFGFLLLGGGFLTWGFALMFVSIPSYQAYQSAFSSSESVSVFIGRWAVVPLGFALLCVAILFGLGHQPKPSPRDPASAPESVRL
ncbi:MAG: hypothetical protein KDA83_10605 [Planctomycetales bacterium]|nr:hypothetical protein [Planctomycetales bacterium]